MFSVMPQVLSSHAAISRKLPAKIVKPFGKKPNAFDDSALITEIREKHRMPDMDQATLWLYVDNQERQRGNTNQMMHSIPELVSEISKYWRLTAGDLIYTGTPKGSGPIDIGQSFEGGVNGAGKFAGKIVSR